MAKDLQATSQNSLPAINVAQPASLLLIPDWLSSQLVAVSDLGAGRTIVDPKTGRITARVTTIPKSLMPTGPQRTAITRRVAELEAATRAGPERDLLDLCGEIISEHASSKIDQGTSAIKADAYMDAVEDLPFWAVREALRRWRRGEVNASPQDLDYAPKPPRLRRIALGIADVAKGQSIRLQRLLDAEPEEALTDAEREANQDRYAGLMKKLASPTSAPAVEPIRPYQNPNLSADLTLRARRREHLDTAEYGTGEGR